jgi:Winged helix DNA-binding domain
VPAPVRFVPDYDNLIATRADERFVARSDRPRVFLSALRIAATVLVDGFVAGAWRVERKKTTATLTVTPFAPLPPRVRKEITAEGEALARFVEPDAEGFEVRIGI